MSDNYVVPVPWEKPYIPPGINPSTNQGYYTGPRITTFGPMNPSTQLGYYTGPRSVTPPPRPVGPNTGKGQTMMGEAARASAKSSINSDITDVGKSFVDDIWARYTNGEITLDQAMAEIGAYGGYTSGGGGGPSRQQIADAISRMTNAARGAQTEIGKAYDVAGGQLDQLMQQYAAAAAAQRAGAGQTLQAFGVDPSQLDVGGMSPQDLLVAQRANVAMQKAAQDAAIADRIAAYQTLLGA